MPDEGKKEEVKPVTEGQENTETVDPLEALSQKVSEKLGKMKAKTDDPLAEFGLEVPPQIGGTTDTGESGEPKKDSYNRLKTEIAQLKQERDDALTRSAVKEALGRVEETFPNAYKPTIQSALRRGANAAQIESIAKASDSDYNRGYGAAAEEFKAELATVRASAEGEAKEKVEKAWGNIPASTGATGTKKMPYKEFQKWMAGKSDEQVAAQMPHVEWGKNNPAAERFRKE